MSRARTDVDVAELATFTIFSASTGKVYACGVTVDVAAGWTQHLGNSQDRTREFSRSLTEP